MYNRVYSEAMAICLHQEGNRLKILSKQLNFHGKAYLTQKNYQVEKDFTGSQTFTSFYSAYEIDQFMKSMADIHLVNISQRKKQTFDYSF
ncbi:hypothetical protein PESHB5_01920 [Pediococcus parvulus]